MPDGLELSGSLATVAGLEIANFPIGILIESPDAFANVITQNVIAGNTVGVQISDVASSNIIGGTGAGVGNVISGNGTGIVITDSGTTGNLVAGNVIGSDQTYPAAAGNSGDGIDINNGATGNLIGASGADNMIAFNQGAGVNVDGTSIGNLVRFNQITGNIGSGIAHTIESVNPFPTSPVLSDTAASNSVTGTTDGASNTTYTLDFYANPAGDTPASPQGRDYLGSLTVSTDLIGQALIKPAD